MKYLGVLISSDLSWSAHIETVVSKARKALGCIYRRFYRNAHTSVLTKLYTTLVRPLLEYCCVLWDPHLEKDIEKLESVQKLACKICTKNWSGSYSDLRHILGLPTIRDRRVFLKLCTMYKITNNIFCFPENLINLRSGFHTHPMSTRSVSGNLLYQPFAYTNSLLYSFVPNTCYLWNGLPYDITSSSSFYCFKYRLRRLILSSSNGQQCRHGCEPARASYMQHLREAGGRRFGN